MNGQGLVLFVRKNRTEGEVKRIAFRHIGNIENEVNGLILNGSSRIAFMRRYKLWLS